MSCKTRFFVPLAAALMLGIGSPGSAFATSSGIDTPPTVGDLPFAINGAMVMDMQSAGLGIGTTTINAALDVNGGIIAAEGMPTSGICATSGAAGYSFIGDYCWDTGMFSPGDGYLDFYTNGTLMMQMYNGNVSIRTPSNFADTYLTVGPNTVSGMPNWAGGIHTYDLYANGTIGTGIGGYVTAYMNNTGTMMASVYLHSSDARLKTGIRPIPHALDKILALQGVQFNWKENGHADMGVVAQNVASVFPDVVTKQSDGMMAVEYDSLVGPMIEAIRELDAKNKALAAKLAVMQDRLDHLPAAEH